MVFAVAKKTTSLSICTKQPHRFCALCIIPQVLFPPLFIFYRKKYHFESPETIYSSQFWIAWRFFLQKICTNMPKTLLRFRLQKIPNKFSGYFSYFGKRRSVIDKILCNFKILRAFCAKKRPQRIAPSRSFADY